MTTGDAVFEIEDTQAQQSAKRWSDFVAWVFPVVGVIALELGTPLWVGLFIVCIKFGWNDFLTAQWLRSDPIPERGKSLSWVLAAHGCFLMALGGTLISLLGAVVANFTQQGVQDPQARQMLMMGTVILPIGWVLGFLLMTIGCSALSQHRIHAWLDPSLHTSRRANIWDRVCSQKQNDFLGWCGPPFLHVFVVGGPLVFVAIVTGQYAWLFAAAFTIAACVQIIFARSLAALTPDECWNTFADMERRNSERTNSAAIG